MRGRNRYDLPLSAGVDPAGWTAGLRHFVDDRYRLVSSTSFDAALRSAVTRMRLTNLPVALTVSHGNHGWILTGFRATADPARTSHFTVTSVRVTGPLYGLQSKNGYDMPPNTKLTTAQLKRFFTPWKYAPMRMVWDGRYVSIQPVPRTSTPAAKTKPKPKAPAPAVTPLPSIPAPTLSPSPVAGDGDLPEVDPTGTATSSADVGGEVAVAEPVDTGAPTPGAPAEPDMVPSSSSVSGTIAGFVVVMLVAAIVGAALVAGRARRRGSG